MKRISYFLFAVITFFVLTSGVTKSTGPPGCHANEPPNNSNCTSCHGGMINQGTAQVDLLLNGADTAYLPGHIYTFTVSVKKAGMLAAGFEFIALQDNNNTISPGSITLTDPARTQKIDVNNPHLLGCQLNQRVWVEHTFQGIMSNAQGESAWSFQWQAPNTDVGSITFYLAALQSDFSGDETGDLVYAKSITTNAIVGIEENGVLDESTVIYFDPQQKKIQVSSDARDIKAIELLDVYGKLIRTVSGIPKGKLNLALEVSDLSKGIYLARVTNGSAFVTKKVIIGE